MIYGVFDGARSVLQPPRSGQMWYISPMQNSSAAHIPALDDELRAVFLSTLRTRFKTELSRMTRGGMASLLKDHEDIDLLSFMMSYVYAWHWLQHNVERAWQAEMLSVFRTGTQAFLMELLLQSDSDAEFVTGYIRYWQEYTGEPELQQQRLLQLLRQSDNSPEQLMKRVQKIWAGLGLFSRSYAIAYRDLAQQEKERYRDMLGEQDRERLALVDQLPDPEQLPGAFAKLGIIPNMACPQTCRHCMFIWRPIVKETGDHGELFQMVDGLTDNVLFTGGDLTKQLHYFYDAIGVMKNITTFAILLNGDFATSPDVARETLGRMAQAIRRRAHHWPKAKVLLQISFDEFHQEVILDRKGNLKERIPVARIASIVEAAPRHADEIQLCLLHKQHALNFSMELFQQGVFARLAQELGRRGHQLQVLSAAPSSRLKRNPQNPAQPAQLLKDASFILSAHPQSPIMLSSSTIDAYGRASVMDENEVVHERDFLQQVLSDGPPAGEYFDTDLMFWFNGWATLFSAVHICLGNVHEEGLELIRRRHQKDPLTAALYRFDKKLLDYYGEVRIDLEQRLAVATGPHQFFHSLTEDADVRLHMTRRLMAEG